MKQTILILLLTCITAFSQNQIISNTSFLRTRNGGAVQLSVTPNSNGTLTLNTVGTGNTSIIADKNFLRTPNGGAPLLSAFQNNDGTYSLVTSGGGGGGGGNVSNTGSPTNGQLALWTNSTTIQGLTALPAANFPALTGDVTTSAASLSTTIGSGAVTYAKMQNVSANSKLLGSSATGGGAAPSEITLGSNLTMTGSTLSVSGLGSGTVTNTGGALTSNSVVLGAGGNDTKVVVGIVSDGVSKLTLGVAGTSVGSIAFNNATSGTLTLAPPTGALPTATITLPNAASTLPIFGQEITFTGPSAARTVTFPDANFTAARIDAGQTFTGVSNITSWNDTTPVIIGGLTASGSGANDFSGSTGTFKTSTGAVTIGPGAITESGVLTLSPPVRTSGVASYFTLNIPADTGQTAATESIGYQHATATRTWATTGTIALQRENFLAGPTYASASASQTFTDPFTLYLTPPIAGTNAIFTREHTLGIVDSTSASSSITGGFVIANTLGTSATSVGIGGGNVNAGGTITGNSFTGAGTGLTGTAASLTAGNVTTNANLTGVITSVGNATSTGAQTGTGSTFVMSAGNPTINGPVIAGGLTASGSGANDYSGSSGTFKTSTGTVTLGTGQVNVTGYATIQPPARSSGTGSYFQITTPADTSLTAATESIGILLNSASRQWASTGTVALQREIFFNGPTYTSVSASQTFTDPFTLYLTPPTAGTNAIFTREHTLGIVDSTSAASSITGGLVVATTLGTAATSVGIGGGNVNAGGTVTGNTVAGFISPTAGTSSTAPITLSSGTNVSSLSELGGQIEYDGVQLYGTLDTTSKRGGIPVEQYFHLTSSGGTISTIANFFGSTSNPSLVANAYYIIDAYMFFTSSSTGTVTWTLTNSAAPTSQNILFEMCPTTGVVAPPGTATMLVGQIVGDSTATKALTATGALTGSANYYTHIKIWLQNGTGTSLKIQATVSSGNITPLTNSYWICRRMSPNNIGAFVN